MYNTVEEIAEHIIKNNDVQELKELFNPQDFWQTRNLRIEFPRWIRNTYKLWDVRHPLTRPWHDGKRLIIDEVDCTQEHPDNVSAAVMRCIKKNLNV